MAGFLTCHFLCKIKPIHLFHTTVGKKISMIFVHLYDAFGREIYYNKIIKTSG